MSKFKNRIPEISWEMIIAIICGLAVLLVAITSSSQPVLEMHGFRQAQTALTTYWIIEEGFQLDYLTPVIGAPWSVPFEFPIYQLIVAVISSAGNLPVDNVGRILSCIFLLLIAWPAYLIAGRLGLSKRVFWIFCALLWSTPLYVFWSRTFMIETAALFFTLASVPYGLEMIKNRPSGRAVALFALFSTLALLQKITTMLPVLFILSLMSLVAFFKNDFSRLLSSGKGEIFESVSYKLIGLLFPLVIAYSWTRYTDEVKMLSEIGAFLTSDALTNWNFGTFAQRFDLDFLEEVFWKRLVKENFAFIPGVALIVYGLLVGKTRERWLISILIIAFLLPIAIFTNLHRIHNYYQTASLVFFVFAMAVSLGIGLSKPKLSKYFLCFFALSIGANVYSFSSVYVKPIYGELGPSKKTILEIGRLIDANVDVGDAIIIYGADWSSEFAYYSKRKAFTVPEWFPSYDSAWMHPNLYVGDLEIGAIVFCEKGKKVSLSLIINHPFVLKDKSLFKVGNCYLWLPNVESLYAFGKKVYPFDFFSVAFRSLPDEEGALTTVTCEGSIDVVNGQPVSSSSTISEIFSIKGWTAVSASDGVLPDSVYVMLEDADSDRWYFRANAESRSDLVAHFKNESLARAGFSMEGDVSDIHGEIVFSIVRQTTSGFELCKNLSRRFIFGPTPQTENKSVPKNDYVHEKRFGGVNISSLDSIQCSGSIDIVDGVNAKKLDKEIGSHPTIKGWLAHSLVDGSLPDRVLVAVVDGEQKEKLFEAKPYERPDVSKYYNQDKLIMSGFVAALNLEQIRGELKLSILKERDGKVWRCSNLSVSASR